MFIHTALATVLLVAASQGLAASKVAVHVDQNVNTAMKQAVEAKPHFFALATAKSDSQVHIKLIRSELPEAARNMYRKNTGREPNSELVAIDSKTGKVLAKQALTTHHDDEYEAAAHKLLNSLQTTLASN